MPHGTLQVFIIILYENVFLNPELFRTQVSLSPEQYTLIEVVLMVNKTENPSSPYPRALY
jgi:hypothetical protein